MNRLRVCGHGKAEACSGVRLNTAACISSATVIVPRVENATWLADLGVLPEWSPPATSTLLLAPHPDDETLAAGALIASLRAQGVPVTVVAATDGENCYELPEDARRAMGECRSAEQMRALRRLGVDSGCIHRLHLNDSGLHLQEEELTDRLMSLASPGMHLLAPWTGDFHPDHEACARAAATVAQEKGLQLTYYFFWTWHRGERDVLNGLALRRFVSDSGALLAKQEALREHHSQLERAGGDPILPASLLGPAFWPFEVFLPA